MLRLHAAENQEVRRGCFTAASLHLIQRETVKGWGGVQGQGRVFCPCNLQIFFPIFPQQMLKNRVGVGV